MKHACDSPPHAVRIPVWLLLALASCQGPARTPLETARVEPPQVEPAQAEPAELEEARFLPGSTPSAGSRGLGDPYYPDLGNGGYDVQHYDLVLDVDMASGELEATATIRAVATQNLASLNLELFGLDIDELRVDGVEASFERDGRELVITPAAALCKDAEFEVIVRYGGFPEPAPDPGIPFVPGVGWFRTSSGVYVLSECSGAASWFPCNDHPLDKATMSYRVTVDKPFVVAANGRLVEEIDDENATTFVFRAADPMATYLATVCIAEFDVKIEEGPEGLPLRTYHPTDATEAELAAFARTGEMIEFFAERFGPYPFESYGAVISYESLGGALETQTLPVYSRGSSEPTVAHELAHQWFGNCVSPATWKDLWLNEGFASYAEFLWFEFTKGQEAAEQRTRGLYRMLRANGIGPPADPGIELLFSGVVYARGPFALHVLRAEVGDEVFFEILREWVLRNFNGHGDTAAFVKLAEEIDAGAGGDGELGAFYGVLYDDELPELAEYAN